MDNIEESFYEEDNAIEETIAILKELINDLAKKIRNGRIKDPIKEEIRIKQLRTLAYLSKTYAKILETRKLEKIERKIELLESKYKKED